MTDLAAERQLPDEATEPDLLRNQADQPHRRLLMILGLALLVAAGALAVLLATTWGIGFEYDSVFYWSAAENLLDGRGLVRLDGAGQPVPLTHFPPLYPLILAGSAGLMGISVVEAGRWIGAALFAINVGLVGGIVWKYTRSLLLALAAGLLVLVSPVTLERHLWAMSEGLFFTFLLGGLALLVEALHRGGMLWILGAAALAAMASLTRYAGVSLIAMGFLALTLFRVGPMRRRVGSALIFAGTAAVPLAAWQIRNQVVSGSLTNRVLEYHPVNLSQLKVAGFTLASWIPYPAIPAEIRLGLLVLVGLGALALIGLQTRGERLPGGEPGSSASLLARAAALHGLVYVGFLLVSLSFFDASTRLTDRILSPLFLIGILTAAGLLAGRTSGRRGAALTIAMSLVVLFTIASSAQSWRALKQSAKEGLGFVSGEWRKSETLQAVRELPADTPIYSNEAFPIYFLTGRPAHWIPEVVDPVKGGPRTDYDQQLHRMRADLREGAVLVLFHAEALRPELPPIETLVDGLSPSGKFEDGVIYSADG